MNRIIFAIVLSLFAGSAMAEPLVLQVDAKPVHKMATQMQAKRGFHLPPLPPPLHFPGDTPTPPPAGNPVADLATVLSTIAIPDLQAAAANAQAQTPPDVTAANCWNGLIPIAQQIQSQLPNPNGTNPIGIAMTIQLARDLINAPTSPVLKQVNLACAALYVDMKVGVLNFATSAASLFAAGAVISPIKPLPIP
jgi:hypothetical protein